MIMRKTFLISVATTALIGASGFALAQAPNSAPNAPAAQSAPAETPSKPSEKAAPMNRSAPDVKAKSDIKSDMKSDNGMKGSQADQTAPADKGAAQHAQDNPKAKGDMKSKGAETKSDAGGKAAADTGTERSKDGMKTDSKTAADSKAGATTGLAGAGGKLTTEQRSSVRTAITKQNVKPAENVNFSISIGTHVPRSVGFHAVPVELVTIYPSWREYEYFLVGDQIVVVNPRTLEIVAVLDA